MKSLACARCLCLHVWCCVSNARFSAIRPPAFRRKVHLLSARASCTSVLVVVLSLSMHSDSRPRPMMTARYRSESDSPVLSKLKSQRLLCEMLAERSPLLRLSCLEVCARRSEVEDRSLLPLDCRCCTAAAKAAQVRPMTRETKTPPGSPPVLID